MVGTIIHDDFGHCNDISGSNILPSSTLEMGGNQPPSHPMVMC